MKKPKEEPSFHPWYTSKTACPACLLSKRSLCFRSAYSRSFILSQSKPSKNSKSKCPGLKSVCSKYAWQKDVSHQVPCYFPTFLMFCRAKADLPRLCCESHDFTTDLPHALVSWQLISHVFWKSKTPKKNLKFVSKLDFS